MCREIKLIDDNTLTQKLLMASERKADYAFQRGLQMIARISW